MYALQESVRPLHGIAPGTGPQRRDLGHGGRRQFRRREPPQILGDLLAAKIAEKRARLIKYQLTISKLPLAKDIDDFDFAGTPINETLIRDLAGGGFLAEQRNPMSNAERQARYRAARAVARPVIQYRSAGDHRNRVRRWHDAVAVLLALQAEYRAWLRALPDSLQDGATAEALQAIDDLDELRRSNRLGASVAISRPPLRTRRH
jgi:hypothetical protein